MTTYLALPSSGKGPGVLVLHAWWGLNETFRDLCDRLAEAGYVALAPDLYNGALARTPEDAERLMNQQKMDDSREIILAGLRQLCAHPALTRPAVGVIGFSMGGFYALDLCNQQPHTIAAAVIFYSTGPTQFDQSRASFLGHFAEDDAFESPAGVTELESSLRAANRPVDFHFYPGTKHWFFEPDRPEFDPAAAQLAWERTVRFLQARL